MAWKKYKVVIPRPGEFTRKQLDAEDLADNLKVYPQGREIASRAFAYLPG